jgi:two-component system response regulator AlgR
MFVRVHRNALVSPKRVRALRKDSSGRLMLALHGTGEAVEVSRRHAAEMRRLLRCPGSD